MNARRRAWSSAGPVHGFRIVALVVATMVSPTLAEARPDPPRWTEATQLVGQIQAPTPKLSERERQAFLARYVGLAERHDALEAEESGVVARLSATRDALKAQVPIVERYALDLRAWDQRLQDHNAACNRTFTNQADVTRCDKAGDALAREKDGLDTRQRSIARRSAELATAQVEGTRLADDLDRRYAAWSGEIDAGLAKPLRTALARKVGPSTLRLTVKSFIRVVDLKSMSAAERPRAEQAFAWLTNRNFSENPATPGPDANDFRLWSQVVVVATCRGDEIVAWKSSTLAHRGGTELRILDAETAILEPLKVDPSPQGNGEVRQLTLSYAIKGKPNDAALPVFQMVRPRTCSAIWHRLDATLSCQDGTLGARTKMTGSRFPSHRVWTNDQPHPTVEQGPILNLWDCNPSAPEMVR